MKNLSYNEVIELLKQGHRLEKQSIVDYGTTSMFRPIKRTGNYITKYFIDGKSIHYKTFGKIIDDGLLAIQSSDNKSMATKKTFYILKEIYLQF